SKYMPEGLRALGSLLNMLLEAAAACKVTVRKLPLWETIGINLDGKYWVGVFFAEPEKLWFATQSRINLESVGRLGVGGELAEESWVPGRYRWWCSVELDSEEVHFFSRTKVNQMQWLIGFLRDCLAKARSIETLDQPPLSEEPEGN